MFLTQSLKRFPRHTVSKCTIFVLAVNVWLVLVEQLFQNTKMAVVGLTERGVCVCVGGGGGGGGVEGRKRGNGKGSEEEGRREAMERGVKRKKYTNGRK